MLSEDGYMALKIQPRNADSTNQASHVVGTFAEVLEEDGYTELNTRLRKSMRPFQNSRDQGKGGRQRHQNILLAIACTAALVSIGFNIFQAVKARPFPVAPSSSGNISCPQDWIGKGGRCYFFSPTEGSWIFSQSNCSSSGGSLVTVDTQAEMDFIMHHKVYNYYWIGLWREDEKQSWNWPNASPFSNWFRIEGDGHCAYLNEDIVSSTWCDNRRRWICSRSLHAS